MDDLRSTFFCCGDQLHPPAGHRHLVVIYLVAVALVSLAAAAHQGWSANLFTLTSDLFPKSGQWVLSWASAARLVPLEAC